MAVKLLGARHVVNFKGLIVKNLFLGAVALSTVVNAFGVEDAYLSLERLDGDDIVIEQANVQVSGLIGDWDTTVSVARTKYGIDYVPVAFDFQGSETHRTESNTSAQVNTRKVFGEDFWLLGSFGVYEGFTSYSGVWLDQYFADQFADLPAEVEGADQYVVADPKGINGSVGVRWQYAPNSGFAQLTVSQLRDDVSSGYEIGFEGLTRGEITLATSAISISTENIVSKRIRTLVELRASRTSLRDWRYGLQVSGNFALTDRLIAKGQVGAANENPGFEAYYGNVELEYALSDSVSLYLDSRYYEDTGEIEDSLLFTSAAPSVETRKNGVGVRWMSASGWSARLYYSRLRSEYAPTNPNTDFFQNLYSDRDWDVAQFSIGTTF